MYGKPPIFVADFDNVALPEVMHYLYLPVAMLGQDGIRLPNNLMGLRPMIFLAKRHVLAQEGHGYKYVYLTARKGWASPDNPLNRPGWHCDGFGTKYLNYIWWSGPGTRFAVQKFKDISNNHLDSLRQFEEQIDATRIQNGTERGLYALDPFVVHATPLIEPPGCMRQFVKISFSDHRYNLADNSHNHLFDYDWPTHPRDVLRNDPHKAQLDYVEET